MIFRSCSTGPGIIDAMPSLRLQYPTIQLRIVGEGPERPRLAAQIERLALQGCVRLMGSVANAELAPWYSAADALVLASSREGWPNVLLESMACGTPVMATRCGGVPEIVETSEVGEIVDVREPGHLAKAISSLLDRGLSRETVRRYAEGRSWHATSEAQLRLFEAIAKLPPGSPPCAT